MIVNRNSKSEILNPKQIQISNVQNSKSFEFDVSNLKNSLKANRPFKGFTLIEMLVCVSIIVIISSISIANYRKAETNRRLALSADGLTNAIRTAQSYTLSAKQISQSTCANKAPAFYRVTINYNGTYSLNGIDNCNNTYQLETYSLTQNTRVKANSLKHNATVAGTTLNIRFEAPFARMDGFVDAAAPAKFTTAEITVELLDGSRSKLVTVDGIAGRIGE